MVLANDLPTDSVLRRHALTEYHRDLGLPPSDAVLRRHYEQLKAAQQMSASAPPTPRASPPSPSGGGLFGWLRRLLGA